MQEVKANNVTARIKNLVTIECPGCRKNVDITMTALGANIHCPHKCGAAFKTPEPDSVELFLLNNLGERNESLNVSSDDGMVIFKVRDYSTEIIGRRTWVEDSFMGRDYSHFVYYVQRGDGGVYSYSADRVLWAKPLTSGEPFPKEQLGEMGNNKCQSQIKKN